MPKTNELLYEVYKAIFTYKQKGELDRKKHLGILKENIISNIKHFLTDMGTKKSLVIDSKTLEEIESHAIKLVKNVEENYSRSFFKKWSDKLIRFVIGKKQSFYKENIALETAKIGKKITSLIENDPNNKESILRDKNLINAKFYLKKVRQFDLLDKLVSKDEIYKLNNKDLDILYRLSVLDISINGIEPNNPLSIGRIQDKINRAEKEGAYISRETMLSDIEAVLNDLVCFSNTPISMEQINEIKYGKSSMLILDFERDVGSEYKKDSDLLKIYQGVVDESNMYFLKEIAFDVASRVETRKESVLLKTYKMANGESARKSLADDLLSQLKEQKSFIVDKLKYADDVEDFKEKLVNQLQAGVLIKHVEAVRAEIEPKFKPKKYKQVIKNNVRSSKSSQSL